MKIFRRSGDRVFLGDEQFALVDVVSVCSEYLFQSHPIHYYDGKKHYVSDGVTQVSKELPCPMIDNLFDRLPELRMCRSQRLNDHKYFENLRNARR